MKIYLDVCCLNRPFDDQSQKRIRLEAEAVLLILSRIEADHWQLLSSEVVGDEIEQTPDIKRRDRLQKLTILAQESISLNKTEIDRAIELRKYGFSDMDALHLACAESGKADVYLTTDDKLFKRATRLKKQLKVAVDNPLSWVVSQKETN